MALLYSLPRKLDPGETQIWSVTLTHPSTAVAVVLTEVSTLTLTLKDQDGNTINSRSAQNVLNTNNVTFHATTGLLTWAIQTADTTLHDTAAASATHTGTFLLILTDGQRLDIQLAIRIKALDYSQG